MAGKEGLHLAGIRAYPLKGARGVELMETTPDHLGIPGDRRWMLVTPEGHFISQRTHPRLCLLRVWDDGANEPGAIPRFRVQAPGLEARPLVAPPPARERMEVRVHQDRFPAQPCGEEEDAWYSGALGEPCRLVFFPDEVTRPTDPAYAPGHQTSFSDGYPLHLTTVESLQALNRLLGRALRMDRFRPNLVVKGAAPWEEDEWRLLAVGEARVQVVKPCARCSVTLVDQATARVETEPLASLSRIRGWRGKSYFGQNAVLSLPGSFAVGDSVRIVERGAARPPVS